MIIKRCPVCKKEFNTFPCKAKNGRGKYCSKKCSYIGRAIHPPIIHICKQCNKKFIAYKSSHKKFCSHKCSADFNKNKPTWNSGKRMPQTSGEKNYGWKGGRQKNSHGYILVYKPNHPFCNKRRYILEHRLVMEKHIGRYLLSKEVVHHINKIHSDNRPENLILFKNMNQHIKHHFLHDKKFRTKPHKV